MFLDNLSQFALSLEVATRTLHFKFMTFVLSSVRLLIVGFLVFYCLLCHADLDPGACTKLVFS